jgi:hypothetical protein
MIFAGKAGALFLRRKIEVSEFGGQTVHFGVRSGDYEFAGHGSG